MKPSEARLFRIQARQEKRADRMEARKRAREGRNRDRDQFFAIEIINNSERPQDLSFLGYRHRHYINESLQIRTIINDQIYFDPEMRALQDILFYKPFLVKAVVFNTSFLYDMFKGKMFHHTNTNAVGQQMSNCTSLENNHQYKSDSGQTLVLDTMCFVDMCSEFKQTFIQPGERLVIMFDCNGYRSNQELEGMIEAANAVYKQEKQRKILLTI